MKIKETYVSHTGLVDVGRFGLFITLQNDGVYIELEELIKQALFFPRVILLGESFEQKEEVSKFCKKLIKENSKVKIEINTYGTIRPIGIANLDSVIYNVHLRLKSSNINYKERIKPNIINWFNQIGSNFIININSEDEMDETNLILQENNISKRDVYLTFNNSKDLNQIRKWAKYYGYNFSPNFKDLLWPNNEE